MLFSNTKSSNMNLPEIRIGNETIKNNSCIQFLGLIIDDQLKWDKHIDVVKRNSYLWFICH